MYKIFHIARPETGVGLYISIIESFVNKEKFETYLLSNKKPEISEEPGTFKKLPKNIYIPLEREINIINDIKCLRKIIKEMKVYRPDLIHCHSAKAGILGRLAGAYLKIPTLYTPHAFSYLSSPGRIKKGIYKSIEKSFRILPAKVLACSTSEAERAVEELRFKKKKVLQWNNSIEKGLVLKQPDLLNGLPENFIASIGRQSYQKNLEMLLEALVHIKKSLPDVCLVLLGIGKEESKIKKVEEMLHLKGLSNNVILIPWLVREELLAVLKASYAYISSSRYEGLPYAIIEAMALKKPCVVTCVDGNKDLIIDGYNGYLIDEIRPVEMAEKMVRLYKEPLVYQQMSENARNEFLKKYTAKRNITHLENIYLSEIKKDSRLEL